jgi:hypothetical protein
MGTSTFGNFTAFDRERNGKKYKVVNTNMWLTLSFLIVLYL